MPAYQAIVEDRTYPISAADLEALDLRATGNGTYHLLKDGQAYHIELLSLDRSGKTVRLRINGEEQHFELRDEIDQAIDALGFSTVESVADKNVFAPMPGLVLDILVEEGAEVTAGTPLIILEAMKMENVLKADGDGTVETISVKKGQAVEKKQLLISVN